MSGEIAFIDCSVCGVEHVDYLFCGGTSQSVSDSIFRVAAKNFFLERADKKRGFDFVGSLAEEFRKMYDLGQKSAP